jgi:hypothetical protein
MSELDVRQREALHKATVLMGVANRALRIADEANDINVRHVGWLQARCCIKSLVGLSQEHPFIQITHLEPFETNLNAVAEKTEQLRCDNGSGDAS